MYEILKLSGALLALCGIVGLWVTIAQGRCHYCGAKNSPIVYHGRRMCLECYRTKHLNTIHRLQLLVQKHQRSMHEYQKELDRAHEALVELDRRQNGKANRANRSPHDVGRENPGQD